MSICAQRSSTISSHFAPAISNHKQAVAIHTEPDRKAVYKAPTTAHDAAANDDDDLSTVFLVFLVSHSCIRICTRPLLNALTPFTPWTGRVRKSVRIVRTLLLSLSLITTDTRVCARIRACSRAHAYVRT